MATENGTALATVSEAEIERNEIAALVDQELAHATKNGQDLPTYYLGKLAQLEALDDAIKAQAEKLRAAVSSQIRALQWRLGAKFRLAVETDLKKQGGKKKSVDYPTGRAGFKSTVPTLRIVDEPALKEWCLANCEAALELKIQRTTPIKDHVKKTGEVPPGAEFVDARDKFYPEFEEAALPTVKDDAARIGGAA